MSELIEREFRALEDRVDSYRGEARDLTVAMLSVVKDNAEASRDMAIAFRELKEVILDEVVEQLEANTKAFLALLDRFANGGPAAEPG